LKENRFKLLNLEIQPKEVKVRSSCDLSISFSLDFVIQKNSCLLFRFRGGRNNKNDWYFLQSEDPRKKGHVKLNLSNPAKIIPMIITGKELLIKFLVCEQEGIKKGTIFQFKVSKTLVQSMEEKNKKIELIIDIPDKKPFYSDNPPCIDVINEKFDHMTIICPSMVAVDEKFNILTRIEDEYKNLVKNLSGKIQLFELSDSNKKVFLAEIDFNEENKGIVKKGGFSFLSPGIYQVEGCFNNSYFKSNPILCQVSLIEKRLYWGFIHGHTIKSDGMIGVNKYFKNLLNAGLHFGTCTDHDHSWETSNEDFEEIKQIVNKFQKDNEFVSFFGYEYGTWFTLNGDICIYYFDENLAIYRSDVNKYNSIKKLIKNLKNFEGKILLIGHHSAIRAGFRNWNYFDNSIEKLVEIYSTWGNQEYSHEKGNPLPPRYKLFGYGKYAKKRGAVLEKKGSFVQDALKRGYKLGFTAGGDDHYGFYPSGSIDPDNGIYPPGIMAIWADNLTKKSIWEALNNRKCYGTTGPRIIIEFYLENYFMGDIIDLKENSQLKSKRNIKVKVISPIILKKLEIIRNNEIFISESVNSEKIERRYQDSECFRNIALTSQDKTEKFVFYYVRIFLTNENMAWSSPIWLILPVCENHD